MSTGARLTLRTYLMYLADALLCGLFLMSFADWVIVQAVVCLLLLIGFCMMCYNEGGWSGEKDVTLDRTAEKRIEEGKMNKADYVRAFNKKHALACFLAASIPLCALAVANLAVSPAYPEPTALTEQTENTQDPFYYNDSAAQIAEEAAANPEPAGQMALRVGTRVAFVPLLPLFTLLHEHRTILYIIFIPFSFVMPACTAIGYLNGPRIREKKIEELARGKVRKRKGLLVGENYVQNQKQQPARRQPKPKV